MPSHLDQIEILPDIEINQIASKLPDDYTQAGETGLEKCTAEGQKDIIKTLWDEGVRKLYGDNVGFGLFSSSNQSFANCKVASSALGHLSFEDRS